MKSKTGFTAWLVYVAVRTIFMVMQSFPIEWNLCTARVLARIWPRVMPRHRQRALTHLSRAYGGSVPHDELERIADRCLQSVAMFAVEAICLPRLINKFTWSRYIRVLNLEEITDLPLSGKGVILVTGHYGSFEVVGHLLASLGFKIAAVMRPLDNAYLNEFLIRVRRSNGLSLLDKKGAMAQAEAILADGALLAFIGDQDAGRKGMFVEFFGRPASTYKSVGLLAMATKCPIVVGYARRRGNAARFDVGVQRIIRPHEWEQRDDPLRWITETYTAAIEEFVRADPEQYLWIHRRWKSQPGRKRRPESTPAQRAI